ncbi:MAG: hypothetical protein INQ03_11545 [Candidatus Heimdallarchaeota archaeon]|nr:hypothetical protein [Candidatus Heimdallarchaeota archaeon]
MSELLSSISLVEKELGLLDGILNQVYFYDKSSTDLIVRLKLGESRDFAPETIGGLVCTIDDLVGSNTTGASRYITLGEVKLIFTLIKDYLLVLAVDPEYSLTQFERFIELFKLSFKEGFSIQNYGEGVDGVALAVQIIDSLISEEFGMELLLGEKSSIFPFKLREQADLIIDEELKRSSQSKLADAMEGKDEEDVSVSEDSEELSQTQALHLLLDRFAKTFSDINSITYIHTDKFGNLSRITKGSISKDLESNILNIVLGMIDTVSLILEEDDEEKRTLDLGDHWIYFYQISLTSFIYIIVEAKESLELVKPLVERIAMSITNLFPEENIY